MTVEVVIFLEGTVTAAAKVQAALKIAGIKFLYMGADIRKERIT